MRDFSLDIYRELLEGLQAKGYELVSYSDYCRNIDKSTNRNIEGKFVILRSGRKLLITSEPEKADVIKAVRCLCRRVFAR